MENETSIINSLANTSELSADKKSRNNILFENLAAEGCENYIDYIRFLGLDPDLNLIALSSLHHYYWDPEELQEVRILLNLKQLNQIKQIGDFLLTINRILSNRTYFIGSFTNIKIPYFSFPGIGSGRTHSPENEEGIGNGILSSNLFLRRVYNIMDAKTDRLLSERRVMELLKSAGLKVQDMTEQNGLTYFCTNKERATA